MKKLKSFEDLRKFLCGKSIAIVGSADTILKEENGDRIDSHDVVIRMNLIDTQYFPRHSGTKTTIVANSFCPDDREALRLSVYRTLSENPQGILLTTPTTPTHLWSETYTKRNNEAFWNFANEYRELQDCAYQCDGKFYEHLEEICTTQPSTGLYVFYIVMKLSTCPVFVTGFSFVENVRDYKHYTPNYRTLGKNENEIVITKDLVGHNFVEEGRLFRAIMSDRVTVDTHMKNRLETIK